jgi:hypothetical protein
MSDDFEACWERFSDQLSGAFADIAASDQLSEETLDKLQFAAVTVFREQLDRILLDRPVVAADRGSLTLQ